MGGSEPCWWGTEDDADGFGAAPRLAPPGEVKLPAVLAAAAWEMRDQGGDDSQRIFPGGRSAIH